jgi:RHS repeat-associated protein
MIAETINSTTNNSATNLYVWGLDISGTLQGAGGIGGLLAAVFSGDPTPVEGFYAYDANGNVSDIVNCDSGAIDAHYEYSPFGEVVVQAGDAQVLALNPYAFSTKYLDYETTLYYYGLRYNNPEIGRWVNRDPMGIKGGINLFAFTRNCPVCSWDFLGAFSRTYETIETISHTKEDCCPPLTCVIKVKITLTVDCPQQEGYGQILNVIPTVGVDVSLNVDCSGGTGNCTIKNTPPPSGTCRIIEVTTGNVISEQQGADPKASCSKTITCS